MRFKVGVLALEKLKEKFQELSGQYEREYREHLQKAVLKVHREAIKSIRESSSGGVAFRYEPKRIVKVSKPGSTPNTDTGTLIKSIGWHVDDEAGIGEVGTNLKYGRYLEFGTQDMEARPWLHPALEKVRPEIIKLFRKGRGKRKLG